MPSAFVHREGQRRGSWRFRQRMVSGTGEDGRATRCILQLATFPATRNYAMTRKRCTRVSGCLRNSRRKRSRNARQAPSRRAFAQRRNRNGHRGDAEDRDPRRNDVRRPRRREILLVLPECSHRSPPAAFRHPRSKTSLFGTASQLGMRGNGVRRFRREKIVPRFANSICL